MPRVEHKPVYGICVSKWATFQVMILNIQVTDCQVGLTRMWKKCVGHPGGQVAYD